MSLLNDALKRAEKVRPDASAFPATPALQPVTLSRLVAPRRSAFLPVLIFCILLLAAFFIWQWYVGVVEVKARTRTATVSEDIKPKPAPTEPAPKTNLPAAAAEPVKSNAPAKSDAPAPISNSVIRSISSALTNWKTAVAPRKESEYKLKGIVFRPKNPSALINGETLFIGDHLGELVLKSIGTNSATISISNGQIQVLELPQ